MFKCIQEYKAKRAAKKRLAELEREKKAQLDHWYLLTIIDLEYNYRTVSYNSVASTRHVTASVYINRYYKTVDVLMNSGSNFSGGLPAMNINKLLSTLREPARLDLISLLKENKIKGYY